MIGPGGAGRRPARASRADARAKVSAAGGDAQLANGGFSPIANLRAGAIRKFGRDWTSASAGHVDAFAALLDGVLFIAPHAALVFRRGAALLYRFARRACDPRPAERSRAWGRSGRVSEVSDEPMLSTPSGQYTIPIAAAQPGQSGRPGRHPSCEAFPGPLERTLGDKSNLTPSMREALLSPHEVLESLVDLRTQPNQQRRNTSEKKNKTPAPNS